MSPKKSGNTIANSIALAPRSRRENVARLTSPPPAEGLGRGRSFAAAATLARHGLELARYALEYAPETRTRDGERADDHDGDQPRDQAVLDRGGAAFLGEQSLDEVAHRSLSPMRCPNTYGAQCDHRYTVSGA